MAGLLNDPRYNPGRAYGIGVSGGPTARGGRRRPEDEYGFDPVVGINEDVPLIPAVGAEGTPLIQAGTAALRNSRVAMEAAQQGNIDRQAALVASRGLGVQAPAGLPTYAPAERGNYNMQNTPPGSLPQPVGGGLNFGFGVNGSPTARQYLDQMSVRDQQAAANRERQMVTNEVMDAQSRLGPNSSAGEILAARSRIAALSPLLAEQTQNQGQLNVAGLQAQAGVADRATQVAGALQERALANEGQLMAANLTGQYGVAAADAKGQAALMTAALEASNPTSQKSAAEAALLQTRLNAILAGVEAGELDTQGVIAASRSGQERTVDPYVDPVNGIPYTAAEIAELQRQRALRAQQPR